MNTPSSDRDADTQVHVHVPRQGAVAEPLHEQLGNLTLSPHVQAGPVLIPSIVLETDSATVVDLDHSEGVKVRKCV
jgi:hypothetical protein